VARGSRATCNRVRVWIFATPKKAARALAGDIARTIVENPRLVLGLPTGRTPVPLYGELVALHRKRALDLSRVTTFNLDEFLGLDAADPHSYRAFMQRHLFDHVNVKARRIQFLDGRPSDAGKECDKYERALRRAGGIDLLLLGLGTNGHIGFNEPGKTLVARTHRATLSAATRRANASWFGNDLAAVPREALSMGMATILGARHIVLLATGRRKARAVERLLNGPITTRLPASLLQLHANVEVWLDRAAAATLDSGTKDGRRGPRRAPV
jgi:glucosamine-6-phosphate deaminase